MTVIDVRHAWRCEGCGRVSNAEARPTSHIRDGEHCGPFARALVAPDGTVFVAQGAPPSQPPAVPDPLRYRQSTLRSYITCPRKTILSSEHTTGTVGSSADLGSAFHAVSAEIRRTLRDPTRRLKRGEALPNYVTGQGESQMSTEEAVTIMREVVHEGSWILTPEDYMGHGDQLGLVQMVCNLAGETWNPSRFMAIEQRLSMEIVCPDGEIRTFTGTPDLVIADPGDPPGLVILDDKTGMARPASPREPVPEGEPIRGVQYMSSDHPHFQLICYSALAMHAWPRAQRYTLREKNWRWMGPPREATITRDFVQEHVLPYLGMLMMQLDYALREGEESALARPRPGTQCLTRCPVAASCPVPQEQRGLGAITPGPEADAAAQRWIVVRALDQQLRKSLKAVHDDSGYSPKIGDGRVVRWREKPSGGREFGSFPPPTNGDAERKADEDFVASMATEAGL